MNNYTREELQYYKRNLYKYLRQYYESYLEYLKQYYERNLKLSLKR